MPAAIFLAACLVVGIADGDTLTARCGEPGAYEQVRVRLAAIDAPEKGQPFGQRSNESLRALCFQQWAKVTPTATDRYGRTVATVQCQGRDAGAHQVQAGMAWVFDRYARGFDHLYPLQAAAKGQRIGLWSDPDALPPWEWRHASRTR